MVGRLGMRVEGGARRNITVHTVGNYQMFANAVAASKAQKGSWGTAQMTPKAIASAACQAYNAALQGRNRA
jgi:hypothetical protein